MAATIGGIQLLKLGGGGNYKYISTTTFSGYGGQSYSGQWKTLSVTRSKPFVMAIGAGTFTSLNNNYPTIFANLSVDGASVGQVTFPPTASASALVAMRYTSPMDTLMASILIAGQQGSTILNGAEYWIFANTSISSTVYLSSNGGNSTGSFTYKIYEQES